MGAAFAAEAGSRGLSLLLVDRDAEALEAQAMALRADGTEVRTLVVDLAAPDAANRVIEAAGDELGLLVSNAAVPFVGPFLDQDLDAVLAQLDVNCRTPLVLVQRLLPRLVERGHGGIVLLSSQSAMRGTALSAGYAATKAWNMILAESLWDEVRDLGVDVLAVLPGPTRTPGFIASAPQPGVVTANMMAPSEVAAESFDALGQLPSIVTGQQNRDSEAFMSSLDRVEAVKIMGDVMRGAYPAERSPDPSL
ncbi:MAG: putative short chain dehydrogenase [Acidimicrobiales bacterium]|nr:putative short chain dehydrogenase [Acidimicrobiales bacterium]